MLVSLFNPRSYMITFEFDYTLVAKMKKLIGYRWRSDLKAWICPVNDFNTTKLREWGFHFDTYAKKQEEIKENKQIKTFDTTAQLRKYQKIGVNFFHKHNGCVLLADEQGLGKTVQTITYINSVKQFPCLIICPASVKLNWVKEIQKWTGNKNVYVCYRREPNISAKRLAKYDYVITNYDIVAGHSKDIVKGDREETKRLRALPSWFLTFKEVGFSMIVLDESQNIKNDNSKRAKAILDLGGWIPHRACLSGTPISNKPIEFFTSIDFIDPSLFKNKYQFARRFCGEQTGPYVEMNGASNLDELHNILTNTIMLRRLKKDVLKELPEKQKIIVPVSMDSKTQQESDAVEYDLKRFLWGARVRNGIHFNERAEALQRLNVLRQLAGKGKMEMVINWINEFLDSGKKLVVFAWHKEIIDTLMKEFKKIAVKIDGSVPANKRQNIVDKFQNDPSIKLFVGNIKAAGTGITLTAASDTCMIELSWSPADLLQAEDRVHRIGQQNNVCNYYLMATGTIDDRMMAIIDEKQKIIDSTMDGKETEEESLLTALMNNYLMQHNDK